jgi:hypothetical protein
MKPPPPSTVILLCSAFWILWSFGYQTVWARFNIQVEGVVVSSRDVPSTGARRYATEYIIRDEGGYDRQYVAGATDAALARSLPIGTRIHKDWGQLDYEVNGTHVRFPTYFYSASLGVALICFIWAIVQWRSGKV